MTLKFRTTTLKGTRLTQFPNPSIKFRVMRHSAAILHSAKYPCRNKDLAKDKKLREKQSLHFQESNHCICGKSTQIMCNKRGEHHHSF